MTLTANKSARVGNYHGFREMFAPGQLTLGVFFPIEAFQRDEPTMRDQEQLAWRAEELGFAARWFRDVPAARSKLRRHRMGARLLPHDLTSP
jgi:alkanesulfonate monooxygenase SsuD/methylene tetrahydromethanopterin reductase-like flavin-dependent oxidoreductase (luciferase family)